jgi:hypothetical protein
LSVTMPVLCAAARRASHWHGRLRSLPGLSRCHRERRVEPPSRLANRETLPGALANEYLRRA